MNHKIWDDYPSDDETAFQQEPESVTCKRCGADGLDWYKRPSGNWVLYDGMKQHHCPKSKAADDFA